MSADALAVRCLFNAMGVVLIVAAFGSGLGGGLGAAKLLFGMGRDNVLPRKFFGHVKPGTSTPTYNILLIGVLSFVGAVLLNLSRQRVSAGRRTFEFRRVSIVHGCECCGALSVWRFCRRRGSAAMLIDIVLPAIGFQFLRGDLVEFESAGEDRRRNLVCDWRDLSGEQDEVFPHCAGDN